MRTDRLIEALKADAAVKPAPMSRAWLMAGLAGAAIAAALFFAMLGPRPDIGTAMHSMRFLFKFAATLLLLATALVALAALGRPAGDRRRAWLMLAVPALLAAAVVVDMAVMPADAMRERWMGSNMMLCLGSIPLLGLGPLAAFLLGLRHGAPTRPTLAGAVAGLAAGGLAATFYAAHCTDDSPLFVASWYTLGIAMLALLGALGGRLLARW